MLTSRRQLPDLVPRLPTTRAAISYSQRQHAGQQRSADGAPFILHPLEVAALLYWCGAPDQVIAAGVLHDVIEKTGADAAELRKRFGSRVATLVVAVSEDEDIIGYEERKQALREQVSSAGEEALMVFAADKISKVRELNPSTSQNRPRGLTGASRPPDRRLVHYRHCLGLLEDLLTDSPLVRQLRAELEKLPGIATRRPLVAVG